ncbi:MAG: spermidine/putrescine ABC transporter substrate-binding protein [Oscillospiraceae bacterium]|nr:spermidine/putrescine ABC transporter substrate-binding protein [Oscillospiraceae bacterium]MDY3937398.1 spermidine/putrescine ABC transporter substrate-binding protein [Oscillospiraceae bacterium]
MKKVISFFCLFLLIAACVSCSFSAFAADESINVYNWGEYIDQDVLDMFYDETGIKVNYTTYDSNETMYSKIVSGAASYDVVVPSDYMISKMAQEGLLAELDFNNIPNYKYIGDEYKGLEYDPDEKYSVSYTWGTVVIIYNTKFVDKEDVEDESVNLLWNEKYAGKILMFDNPRDAFGLALKKAGYSLNSLNENDWSEAQKLLKEQKPLVQAYVMDQIFDKMASEEAWIAPYYAGDAYTIQQDNPDISFYLPKEGSNFFTDAMCVLKSSQNKENAEKFINFMCRTDIALMNAEEIGYGTPQTEAYKLLDEEVSSNELLYPSTEKLRNQTEVFINLPSNISMLQSALWTSLKVDGEENSTLGYDIAFYSIIGILALILGVNIITKQHRKRLYRTRE